MLRDSAYDKYWSSCSLQVRLLSSFFLVLKVFEKDCDSWLYVLMLRTGAQSPKTIIKIGGIDAFSGWESDLPDHSYGCNDGNRLSRN